MTIFGRFGDEDALIFEVALIDDQGLELQIDAMFDSYVIQQKYIK